MIKVMCADCSKKDKCRSLCREAEKYVNQDEVKWNKIILSENVENFSNDEAGDFPVARGNVDLWKLRYLTDKQKEVIDMYLNKGMTFAEIGSSLRIGKQSVIDRYYLAINKIRKKIAKRIKKL